VTVRSAGVTLHGMAHGGGAESPVFPDLWEVLCQSTTSLSLAVKGYQGKKDRDGHVPN
jgi:hypothetical protein